MGVHASQFQLGLCYGHGCGKPMDYGESAKWYIKASENCNASAAHNLAFYFWDGLGVPQNRERAMQYWKLAAGRGKKVVADVTQTKKTQEEINDCAYHELPGLFRGILATVKKERIAKGPISIEKNFDLESRLRRSPKGKLVALHHCFHPSLL